MTIYSLYWIFPLKMVILHSYVNVYQKVSMETWINMVRWWFGNGSLIFTVKQWSLIIHLLSYVTYHHFSVSTPHFGWWNLLNSPFLLLIFSILLTFCCLFTETAPLFLGEIILPMLGFRLVPWSENKKRLFLRPIFQDWTPYWMTFPMVLKIFEVWILTGQHLKGDRDRHSESAFQTPFLTVFRWRDRFRWPRLRDLRSPKLSLEKILEDLEVTNLSRWWCLLLWLRFFDWD